jgi:thiol-disulfide isomerase/thioredoxin
MNKRLNFFLILILLVAFNYCKAQEIQKWKLSDLKAAIKNADKPTVFNFWATFCQPCVKELPYFQELVKKYDSTGVKLILVSLDLKDAYPKKIQSFAEKHGFTSSIKYLDETNADLFCPAVDNSWSGSIPASLFINNKTGYRKFFEEELSREKFATELRNLINSK